MLIYTAKHDDSGYHQLSPLRAKIVEMITNNPMSAKEIADTMNLKTDNVRTYITKASCVVDIYTDRQKFWTVKGEKKK